MAAQGESRSVELAPNAVPDELWAEPFELPDCVAYPVEAPEFQRVAGRELQFEFDVVAGDWPLAKRAREIEAGAGPEAHLCLRGQITAVELRSR